MSETPCSDVRGRMLANAKTVEGQMGVQATMVSQQRCLNAERVSNLNPAGPLTNEGRERARKVGVKFGPKFKLSPHQMEESRKRKEAGESCRFLARSYGVSANTISRVK